MLGQFGDGSIASIIQTSQAIDAPSGIHTFPRTLVVAEAGGKYRNFVLPTLPELFVVSGNTTTQMKVPANSVQKVAICERGFVVIADSVVKVYDRSFRLLFTPLYRGNPHVLSASDRQMILTGGKSATSASEAKFFAAVDAAQPKRLVQYIAPVVSAEGLIWYNLAGPYNGRFVRTTPAGEVIDTVLAPYQLHHAIGRSGVASGPFKSADEEIPTVLLKQLSTKRNRKPDPVSPLGHCNAVNEY